MKKLFLLLLSVLFVMSCSKDPIIYTLTTSANPSDGGTVSPTTKQYNEGETATITATPSSEYVFQSWLGATGSTNSTSVVMNSDKTVTANFVKKKFALTISVEGEGTVTEKVIKAGSATDYTIGSVIELTANPSDEWLFVEWKGDVTGTENPVEITVDKAKAVTAVFVKKQYPLTIEVEGEGTVAEKVIKAGAATDYNSGTVVELTATGKTGWEFKEWTGDLESTENPAEITIDGSKTVKAVFVKKQFAVNITIEGEGGGTVAEEVVDGIKVDSKYEYGTELKLTATPSAEWEFSSWKEDLEGTENPQTITIDTIKAVTAVFVKKQYPLTIEIEGDGSVAEKVIKAGAATDYNSGTVLELTATGKTGWVFKEWKGDVTGTENPLQLTINEAKNVTAVFVPFNSFIYLPFNGSVNDESINNFEIDSNGVELTSDRHGNENSAYLFSNGLAGSRGSGAGDVIFSKQKIFTNSLENYTISFWVYFSRESNLEPYDPQMPLSLLGGNPDNNGSGGDAFYFKNNALAYFRSTFTGNLSANASSNFTFGWDVIGGGSGWGKLDYNKWYNVSLIRDGDNQFHYLNGEKVLTITGLNNYDFENSKTRLRVGNNTYNYKNGEWTSYIQQMKGKIDEVIIWERSLSENEIKEIYNR